MIEAFFLTNDKRYFKNYQTLFAKCLQKLINLYQFTSNPLVEIFCRDKAIDTCDGDSGGPLMWRYQDQWFLNGITSFGTTLQSCRYNVIGVYTKVDNYLNFLDANIILAP